MREKLRFVNLLILKVDLKERERKKTKLTFFLGKTFYVDAVLNFNSNWTKSHSNNPIDISAVGLSNNPRCKRDWILKWTPKRDHGKGQFGDLKCQNKKRRLSAICAYDPVVPTTTTTTTTAAGFFYR